MTLRACVMGYRIAHSRSPLLHGHWIKTLAIDGSYELADVAPAEFPAFLRGLRTRGYAGGNVTVPHKEVAFSTVDMHDADATAIGAVNTVWHEGARLVGGNTDAYGFIAHLDATRPGWSEAARRAVVLGAGGAARAVTHALLGREQQVHLVNRTAARAKGLAAYFAGAVSAHGTHELPKLLAGADLLVNATSLGMAGQPPLDIELKPLKGDAIVYDLVYVPVETDLLRRARARGNPTVDGLGMLLHQAVPGFARWFGVTPRVTPELRALLEGHIRRQT